MAPAFSKGLQYIPVFKNFPYLWMTITLDGFGYHLEDYAFKVFVDRKILIVKEEGYISQVCQFYDNEVTKSDKHHHRDFPNGIRCDIHYIDQWTIIVVDNKVCSLFASYMLSCLIKQMTNAAPRLP